MNIRSHPAIIQSDTVSPIKMGSQGSKVMMSNKQIKVLNENKKRPKKIICMNGCTLSRAKRNLYFLFIHVHYYACIKASKKEIMKSFFEKSNVMLESSNVVQT